MLMETMYGQYGRRLDLFLLIYCLRCGLYENKIYFRGLENIKDYFKMKITRDDLLIAGTDLYR